MPLQPMTSKRQGRIGRHRLRLQIDRSGARQFRTFACPDRMRAIATRVCAAIAYFDKDDLFALAHDEIQLAITASEIACQQGQSGMREVRQCSIFPLSADAACAHVRADRDEITSYDHCCGAVLIHAKTAS